MPNTTITRMGLDFASSASPIGSMIAPIYFVPVYDHRIDSLIHDSVIPVSAFSACVDVDATVPFGEILWRTSAAEYSLSDVSDNFIISAGNATSAAGPKIISPVQSQKWQVNLKNGVPLTNHWVSTSASFNPGDETWSLGTDIVMSAGSNPTPAGTDKYFPIVDYYPVSADTEDSKVRGRIKCRVVQDVGTIKFNKIAVYIAHVGDDGMILPGEPVLFAISQLKTTLVKTNFAGSGFDEVTVDIDFDLHSLSADWAEVFFSTSGDYWSRVPGGVHYSEKVGIGQFDGDTDEPGAALHVKPPRNEPNARLIKFERGNNYSIKDITAAGKEESRLFDYNLSADNGTMTEILDATHGTIYPVSASSMDLGKETQRFRSGYFDYIHAASISADSFSANTSNLYNAHITNLSADYEHVAALDVDYAFMDRMDATALSAASLSAANGNINTLAAQNINLLTGKVTSFEIRATTITADILNVGTIIGDDTHFPSLSADEFWLDGYQAGAEIRTSATIRFANDNVNAYNPSTADPTDNSNWTDLSMTPSVYSGSQDLRFCRVGNMVTLYGYIAIHDTGAPNPKAYALIMPSASPTSAWSPCPDFNSVFAYNTTNGTGQSIGGIERWRRYQNQQTDEIFNVYFGVYTNRIVKLTRSDPQTLFHDPNPSQPVTQGDTIIWINYTYFTQ